MVRDSWDSSLGVLAGGQGRKSELFSSKGDEPPKVLFPSSRSEAWIEQVCPVSGFRFVCFEQIYFDCNIINFKCTYALI